MSSFGNNRRDLKLQKKKGKGDAPLGYPAPDVLTRRGSSFSLYSKGPVYGVDPVKSSSKSSQPNHTLLEASQTDIDGKYETASRPTAEGDSFHL